MLLFVAGLTIGFAQDFQQQIAAFFFAGSGTAFKPFLLAHFCQRRRAPLLFGFKRGFKFLRLL